MKRLFYFLLMICVTYLYSCNGDDPEPDTEDPTFEVKAKIGINGTLKSIIQGVNFYASSGDTVYLSGTFEDDKGLKSIRLQITTSSGDIVSDNISNSFDDSKMHSYNVLLPIPSNFSEGSYNVKITATDHGNNEVSIEGNLFIDNTAPTITLIGQLLDVNDNFIGSSQNLDGATFNINNGLEQKLFIGGTVKDNKRLQKIITGDIDGNPIQGGEIDDNDFENDSKEWKANYVISFSSNIIGRVTLTLTAIDLSNNQTSITFTIVLR